MVVINNKLYTIKRNTKSLFKYQKNKKNANKRTKKKIKQVDQMGSGFFFTSKYENDINTDTTSVVSEIITIYYRPLDELKKENSLNKKIKAHLDYINTTYKEKLRVCLSKCIKGILQYFYTNNKLRGLHAKIYTPNTDYNQKTIQTIIKKKIINIFIFIYVGNNNKADEPIKTAVYGISEILKNINALIPLFKSVEQKIVLDSIISINKRLASHLKYICNNKNTIIEYCKKYIDDNTNGSQQTYQQPQWR
jgi:hypothetical protein